MVDESTTTVEAARNMRDSEITVRIRCQECDGDGDLEGHGCSECEGTGKVLVWLPLPMIARAVKYILDNPEEFSAGSQADLETLNPAD